jgi:DNA invertase Pin-like site-specific DNA recombinase
MEQTINTNLKYCLYARKSSESDEKQAMSIDGQLREMSDIAKREKINVVEVVTESHSAKETGQRPQFNYMLENVNKGKYNAIITWAPDRISRNAGDLGRVVDLMDQGRLSLIKTHSQTFSNNPNEKFLLMILCSQAKLENDNRGINVKRGLRNKCQVGIRPCMAPLGYLNVIKSNRIHTVVPDLERAPTIKQMFSKVANEGYSGRMIREWFKRIDFRTPRNVHPSLSRIFEMLNNTFYYGEFKFGNKWYKGVHEPLITKKLFEKVQIRLQTVPRQWNKQLYPFKKLCLCGTCGGSITAETKYKRTKSNNVNTHIYYHCNHYRDNYCPEPYITEEELIKQLIAFLPNMKLDTKYLWNSCNEEIKRLNNLQSIILLHKEQKVALTKHNKGTPLLEELTEVDINMIQDYLIHVLQFGTPEERHKILGGIKSRFILHNRVLTIK